jgi:hypothetical protein
LSILTGELDSLSIVGGSRHCVRQLTKSRQG